jgi:hypothetical protein
MLEGLSALVDAWAGFDAHSDSHCSEWAERTAAALAAVGSDADTCSFVARRWPMPMVELEVERVHVKVEDLIGEREAAYNAWLEGEFGHHW